MANLFQRTVELLQNLMDRSRDTWLIQAFYSDHRKIYNSIDQSGAARDFTTRCIKELDKTGYIAGQHAVSVLIEEMKHGVGSDKQREFDALIREWNRQCREPSHEDKLPVHKPQARAGAAVKRHEQTRFDVFYVTIPKTNRKSYRSGIC